LANELNKVVDYTADCDRFGSASSKLARADHLNPLCPATRVRCWCDLDFQ
jgi:hypothetical protein